jgi:archaellum component FlaG (FlaF/FlaG flagellin family)|tara:strand:+ start:358 stop:630 length:273 start_codon:yes stop_codon:yes gene_type:complete
MKEIVIIIGAVVLASCATVGAVIDGGKDLTTSVIDSTVKTAGNITNSALEDVAAVVDTVAESTENIVDNVVDQVDEQTDELQEEEETQEK